MPTTAATTVEQTGAHKRSVRNYLLDSRFQLKYTGFIVLVAVAISAAATAVKAEPVQYRAASKVG